MHVPQWLALAIAGVVILFGVFRLYLAVAGPSDEQRAKQRSGLYRMSRRQHGLVGVLFLLVAGALVATAWGWNPMAPREREVPARPGANEIRIPAIDIAPADPGPADPGRAPQVAPAPADR